MFSPTLALTQLTKSFGGLPVLEPLSLTLPRGEFLSLLGPSGCGKSTLLRLIAGLEPPTSGTASLGETPHPAYVFQDPNLLPWRTVLSNVALPLELRGVARTEREQRAQEVLSQMGLADAGALMPRQLSGGMKMRVSLARALVTKPDLLLLDEPFSALDELTRFRLGELLRDLWLKSGLTVIFVTHSISEAVYLSERIAVFSQRPARLIADERVALPRERNKATRGEESFARETVRFRGLLESGMGAQK